MAAAVAQLRRRQPGWGRDRQLEAAPGPALCVRAEDGARRKERRDAELGPASCRGGPARPELRGGFFFPFCCCFLPRGWEVPSVRLWPAELGGRAGCES